jgi:hypothetical protein
MIELVARKASTGEVDINRARSKGGLHDVSEVEALMQDIHARLHGGPEPRTCSSARLDSTRLDSMVTGI